MAAATQPRFMENVYTYRTGDALLAVANGPDVVQPLLQYQVQLAAAHDAFYQRRYQDAIAHYLAAAAF
jgi:hypothetical protein